MSAQKLYAVASLLPAPLPEPADGQVLRFDFGLSRRPDDRLGKGPVSEGERSSLKAAILNWLDEQL